MQKTGHAPAAPASLLNLPVSSSGGASAGERRPSPATTSGAATAASSRPAEYSKLVRGQDVWLSGGGERTRRSILRCIQCGESFRSLPELTVHMVHTRHYTNIVGGGGAPTASSSSASGHVTSELPVVGSTHHDRGKQRQPDRASAAAHSANARISPIVMTSRESLGTTSPGNHPMTSSSSPCQLDEGSVADRGLTATGEHSEYDVTPLRSANHSPASLSETETGRQSAGNPLGFFQISIRTLVFIARQHAYACTALTILLWQICLSVCLSHASIASKRMHISSNSLHHLVEA